MARAATAARDMAGAARPPAPAQTWSGAGSSRCARAAGPCSAWCGCPNPRRSTRATPTRPARSPRNTWPRYGRPAPAARPRVFEDGGQCRDFVHVLDVATANLAALAPGALGQLRAYNIASGEPHTVADMAAALASAFGGPQPLVTGEFRL